MEFDKQSIPGSYNVCRQTAKYSVQVVIVWAIKFTFGYSFLYGYLTISVFTSGV